jgi:hypothetical protein
MSEMPYPQRFRPAVQKTLTVSPARFWNVLTITPALILRQLPSPKLSCIPHRSGAASWAAMQFDHGQSKCWI